MPQKRAFYNDIPATWDRNIAICSEKYGWFEHHMHPPSSLLLVLRNFESRMRTCLVTRILANCCAGAKTRLTTYLKQVLGHRVRLPTRGRAAMLTPGL